MRRFLAELKKQRWDDHRYYHHSRINQTLHLGSALSFLAIRKTGNVDTGAHLSTLVDSRAREGGKRRITSARSTDRKTPGGVWPAARVLNAIRELTQSGPSMSYPYCRAASVSHSHVHTAKVRKTYSSNRIALL